MRIRTDVAERSWKKTHGREWFSFVRMQDDRASLVGGWTDACCTALTKRPIPHGPLSANRRQAGGSEPNLADFGLIFSMVVNIIQSGHLDSSSVSERVAIQSVTPLHLCFSH